MSWKSIQWKGVVPFGRTDITKLIVAFRNFANAPKKEKLEYVFFYLACTYAVELHTVCTVSKIEVKWTARIPVKHKIL
jgi:hypothetical protein